MAPLVDGSLEGADRVSEIVQNLRRFATPQESRKQQFNLVQVIRRATSWVLKSAPLKPELVNELPTSLDIVNNEGYVHQILINLIQNAIDALLGIDKPQLHIALNVEREMVHIHIRDNGQGIVDADLVKVFDPFFTTKEVGSGTGLGLYISYGLAREQCGGNLSVNNLERGAEFTLSLPLEAA